MADIRINALATTATTPASDDYLALDGTAQGTRKILATNIANNVTDVILGSSGPSVKSTLSARAPRQGLVFDGTFGASFSGVPAFGTGDFTVSAWINPSTLATVGIIAGGTSSFSLRFQSNGTLNVGKVNVSDGTPSTGAVSAGKFSHVSYVKSGSTGTYYINGISSGTSSETGLDYSAATTLVGAYSSSTTQVFSGTISGGLIYNRALSASEVVALYEAGAPAGADYASGGAANSVYTTDFSSSTGWSLDTGVTISGGKLNLANNAYASAPVATAIVKGTQYRFTITVDSVTSGANVSYYNGSSYVAFATAAGTYTVNFTAAASFFALTFNSFGGSGAVVDNFTFDRVGLLLAPDAAQAGGGLVWYDTSGNAANITLPASGVSWNVPSSSYWGGQLKLQSTTGTNGLRINNISSDTFGFFGGGNDGLPVFSSLNNATIGSATYGWLAYNSTATGDFELYRRNNSTTNTAALIVTRSTGNLLIGTNVDSSALLQVGTNTTTAAGGMKFGTDTSLYRSAAGQLRGPSSFVDATFSSSGLFFGASMTLQANDNVLIKTNGSVTALTLDTSQNATFAGSVRPEAAPSSKWAIDFASGTGSGAYVTIANDGTYDVAVGSGMLFVWDDGGSGVSQIMCYYGQTAITWQDGTFYTVTADTANKVNVYYNAGTNKYRVQNKSGSSKNFYISTIRLRQGS
jgi:hypothetical protein